MRIVAKTDLDVGWSSSDENGDDELIFAPFSIRRIIHPFDSHSQWF